MFTFVSRLLGPRALKPAPAQAAPLPRHRFAVSTTNFTTSTGEVMTDYTVLSYGTSAADAAARALRTIAARYSPPVLPSVAGTACDMGCIDSGHS